MVQYPDCPFCKNSNSALSVVDVVIDGFVLKGIFCNGCKKYIGYFQDIEPQIAELKEKIEELESNVSDLEQ